MALAQVEIERQPRVKQPRRPEAAIGKIRVGSCRHYSRICGPWAPLNGIMPIPGEPHGQLRGQRYVRGPVNFRAGFERLHL